MKHEAPKHIAVDVDGTLLDAQGRLQSSVVDWCADKIGEGYTLMLWSSRGAAYALQIAEENGVSYLFQNIVSKPGIILDDRGTSWMRFVRVLRPS